MPQSGLLDSRESNLQLPPPVAVPPLQDGAMTVQPSEALAIGAVELQLDHLRRRREVAIEQSEQRLDALAGQGGAAYGGRLALGRAAQLGTVLRRQQVELVPELEQAA